MQQCIKRMLTIIAILIATTAIHAADPIKVLIVDGPQKYHDFKKTTPILKEILEKSGRFKVDLSRSTTAGCKDGSYKPDFSQYAVIVVNEGFGAQSWPKATEEAFEKYISEGGGMVSYHAANNAWPKWKAFNLMTGLGGWSGRNHKSGPYLYIDAT